LVGSPFGRVGEKQPRFSNPRFGGGPKASVLRVRLFRVRQTKSFVCGKYCSACDS
jgi:hypothetical protein